MKILFTGASSFTGYWFVKALKAAGNHVTAIFRKSPESYSGTRKKRVDELQTLCESVFECEFGHDAFLRVLENGGGFDLFCHHAAEVENYRSYDFDFLKALERNTKNLPLMLQKLKTHDCSTILLTGTVFEQDEGEGSHLGAVYPYALSKGLTAQVFRYYAEKLDLNLGKFIVASPFGPYEEAKFSSYMMRSWLNREIPVVQTPAYIRDNIHADLLAKAYARYAKSLFERTASSCFAPSFWVESQEAFALRLAEKMSSRLRLGCTFKINEQKEFLEPLARYNTDTISSSDYDWNEDEAWDQMAKYYLEAL